MALNNQFREYSWIQNPGATDALARGAAVGQAIAANRARNAELRARDIALQEEARQFDKMDSVRKVEADLRQQEINARKAALERAAQIEAQRQIGLNNYRARLEQLQASGADPQAASTQALIENISQIHPEKMADFIGDQSRFRNNIDLAEMRKEDRFVPSVGSIGDLEYFMASPNSAQIIKDKPKAPTMEQIKEMFPDGFDTQLTIGPSGPTTRYAPKKETTSKPPSPSSKIAIQNQINKLNSRMRELTEESDPENWTDSEREEVNRIEAQIAELQSTPAPRSETVITIKTKDEFDKLPKGAIFVGSDGKQYRKP